METIELGSIYLDGQARSPGCFSEESSDVTVGNTVRGKALEWAQYKDLLVATHCACFSVSWENLNRVGLITGTPVVIDGSAYLCRSLKLGATPQEFCEWDNILNKLGNDDKIWDWRGNKFWGQESSASLPIYRVLRGGPDPTHWWSYPAATRVTNIGFRPVLEPLSGKPAQPADLLKKAVVAYGPLGIAIRGKLVDFDGYDLVIDSPYHLYDDCYWATRDGDRITVDRASIAWLKEDAK